MAFKDFPIRRKLMTILLLVTGATLMLTCLAFIGYEYFSFRGAAVGNLATLGRIIANNSTAALAFDNRDDAQQVLAALRTEPHVVVAALYDSSGALFARYPAAKNDGKVPVPAPAASPGQDGYRFDESGLVGLEPVREGGNRRLGTLYLRSDLGALHEQLTLYSLIAAAMTALAFLVAYVLSRVLQQQISRPVQMLASAARTVYQERDYSVRADKVAHDELGNLADAFNRMLEQIQIQDRGLRQSEVRLRAVLDSSLSAIVVIDSDGRVTDWNPRAVRMFGWANQEALGRDVAELIIPEPLREGHRQGLRRFLETGEARVLNRVVEMSALRRDGSEFPIELFVRPLQAEAPVTFCAFVTDITERKQARDRLQTQLVRLDLLQRITRAIGERQDLRSIFQVVIRRLEDNLPIDFGCIGLYDPTQQVLTVTSVGSLSRALALDLALTEQARIPVDRNGLGRCVRGELVYEPDIADSSFPFPQRLSQGGLRSVVFAPLLAASKIVGVLIVARRLAHSFESSDCEFLRQLSEHVGLAGHQAQLYDDLQRSYEDLRQSQQAVLQQERLRALGQMASGVAHDINNAISPVSIYAESLLDREPGLSDRARKSLMVIQQCVEDVARTVSRMRDFYRKREPQIVLGRVDVNQIVQGVIELTRSRWKDVPQARGVVVNVRTELGEMLPQIMGAENEIRDALTNLVLNAVDAMPEGGVLTVRTRVDDMRPTAPALYLEVIDTGVGMDEDTRRRCLEPFFTTKGERGTGMGLAMVYGMIERHSADLEIESAPGQGTTVRLIFPLPAMVIDATVQQPVLALPTRSVRILVVDDDPLIIESLSETLRGDGHEVIAADGGEAGINTFLQAQQRGETFAAVITDLGMPYIDGRRVAAAVKGASPSTPVILLTGWGQQLIAENEVPLHVDRVLNKPPRLRELRVALAELNGMAGEER
jgi:PAS domain S-box-containing protein